MRAPAGGRGSPQVALTITHISLTRAARAVHDLIPFNKAVVGINFITLFYYLFVQFVLAGREYWCIDRFDEEPTLRVDNLKEELKLYPRLRDTLHRLNNIAATLSVSLLCLMIGCAPATVDADWTRS